jgi:ADP-L-glycero-D-manno-heptose 6-epimerase
MILVTGGAGFIGSNLVAALEERGLADIAVCDRLGSDEKWRNLGKRELAALIAPEQLKDFLAAQPRGLDAIFHLGASSSTTETDADFIIANNFAVSQMLWDWCTTTGTRFIYASSAATYGDGDAGFDDDGTPAGLAKLKPLNAYGWSKQLFDRRIARLIERSAPKPPQWAGLKFFNVYGPNEYHKGGQKSVVAQIFPRAQAHVPCHLFRSHRDGIPDGGQKRDFVYVRDSVAEMLFLYDHPEVSGLFNAGSGEARSFADLATAVYRALSVEPRIHYIDTPVEIRDKYQYFTEAKMERIRTAGFTAAPTSLEDGVRDYVQNFLASADPYR